MNNFLLTIVVPCHNEAENLPVLVERLREVLKEYNFELLLVNDGSTDHTQEVANWLAQQHSNISYICLSRNFGHQMALKAGIDHARGDCVLSMDADLQHPPETIPGMINLWQEGFEVVSAVRKKQEQPSIFKRVGTKLFYIFLHRISDRDMMDPGSDFRLFDKKIVAILKDMPEQDLYLRGLFSWMGFKQTTLAYTEAKRMHGKTKYSFGKMLGLAGNGITSSSIKPLRVALAIGTIFALLAFVYGLYAIGALLWGQTVPGWASIMATTMFLAGIQLIVLGVMGEYLGKMYMAAKQRPGYLVTKTNIKNNDYNITYKDLQNNKPERRNVMT